MSDSEEPDSKSQDFRTRFKHSRLRDQVDLRVDQRVDSTLSARLSVIERAIADLDRSIKELQERSES